VRSFFGWVFHYLGDSLRAIEQFEEARRLNPVDPKSYFPMLGLAAAQFFAGHFDDTVSRTECILVTARVRCAIHGTQRPICMDRPRVASRNSRSLTPVSRRDDSERTRAYGLPRFGRRRLLRTPAAFFLFR